MKEMTVQELKTLQDSGADFQLVDVREPYEYDDANLGALLIPLGEVMDRWEEIARDKTVVIHCRSGKRSATAIEALSAMHGFDNLHNLKGGILAYAAEIDPSLQR